MIPAEARCPRITTTPRLAREGAARAGVTISHTAAQTPLGHVRAALRAHEPFSVYVTGLTAGVTARHSGKAQSVRGALRFARRTPTNWTAGAAAASAQRGRRARQRYYRVAVGFCVVGGITQSHTAVAWSTAKSPAAGCGAVLYRLAPVCRRLGVSAVLQRGLGGGSSWICRGVGAGASDGGGRCVERPGSVADAGLVCACLSPCIASRRAHVRVAALIDQRQIAEPSRTQLGKLLRSCAVARVPPRRLQASPSSWPSPTMPVAGTCAGAWPVGRARPVARAGGLSGFRAALPRGGRRWFGDTAHTHSTRAKYVSYCSGRVARAPRN